MSRWVRVALRLACLVAVALSVVGLTASSASAAGTLAIEPGEASFGVLRPGKDDSRTLTVRNMGPDSVQISDIYIFGDVDPFDFLAGSCDLGVTLPAAGECSLTLEFAPVEAGDFEAVLVAEGDGDESGVATLTGRSRPPGKLVAIPSFVDFGGVRPNAVNAPQTIRLHNDGGTPIDIRSISAVGDGTNIVSNGCGNELAPLATCEVLVVFRPVPYTIAIATSERAIQSSDLWISAYAWDQFPVRNLQLKVPMRATVLKPSGKPYPSKQELAEYLRGSLSRMASAAIRSARGGPARPLWLRFPGHGLDGKLGLTLRAHVGKRWVAIANDATAVHRDAGARFSFQLMKKGKRLLRAGKPVRVKAETRFTATDRFVLDAAIEATEQAKVKPAKPKKKRKRR